MNDDNPVPVPSAPPIAETAPSGGPDVLIDDLELSIRGANVLLTLDITTLGQLAQMTETELLTTKNCGRKVLKEMTFHLAEHGLRLGMTAEEVKAAGSS